MAYYQRPPTEFSKQMFGVVYQCDNPVYNRCTLYKVGEAGLAIIQQRFNAKTKHTWWDCIDPWLANDIYTNENFPKLFKKYAALPDTNGIYPTICVRPAMRQLGMPPLEKDIWETRF